MSVPELETELKYFEEHRNEFVKLYLGKFALIKGVELIGTYDTAENAYEAGAGVFSGEAFLIKQVLPEDPIVELPAYFTGLLYASV